MTTCYLAYAKGEPVALEVNGHRLLFLSHSEDDLEEGLALLGGDEVRCVEFEGDLSDEMMALGQKAAAGIVVTPGQISIEQVLESLEAELPWVH